VPMDLINFIIIFFAVVLILRNVPQKEAHANLEYHKFFMLFINILAGYLIFFGIMYFASSRGHFSVAEDPNFVFSRNVILYAFLFIVCSIVYMRLVRHDAMVLEQTRFKVMNIISFGNIIIIGIVFGNEFLLGNILGLIGFVAGSLFSIFIAPVIYYLSVFLLFFAKRLGITVAGNVEDYTTLISQGVGDYDYELLEMGMVDTPPNYIFAIFAILMILVLIILYKKIMKQKVTKIDSDGIQEEHFFLDGFDKKSKFAKNKNENKIRAVYGNFLRFLKNKAIAIPDSATSTDIEELAYKKSNIKELTLLKEEYIKVRYGEQTYTNDDVSKVRELYQKIKNQFDK